MARCKWGGILTIWYFYSYKNNENDIDENGLIICVSEHYVLWRSHVSRPVCSLGKCLANRWHPGPPPEWPW